MILIKVSYPTMIKRIEKRGREYEQVTNDPSLVDYYKRLLEFYDEWERTYDKSPLLVIDGDKYDFVENKSDRQFVFNTIADTLLDMGKISRDEHLKLYTEN